MVMKMMLSFYSSMAFDLLFLPSLLTVLIRGRNSSENEEYISQSLELLNICGTLQK